MSEVDLSVFPGLRGAVVTTSRCALAPGGAGADSFSSYGDGYGAGYGAGGAEAAEAPPLRLELTVESTRVERSTFSPLLDSIAVPVERLVRLSCCSRATFAAATSIASLPVAPCPHPPEQTNADAPATHK